jgi:hypothetical protein
MYTEHVQMGAIQKPDDAGRLTCRVLWVGDEALAIWSEPLPGGARLQRRHQHWEVVGRVPGSTRQDRQAIGAENAGKLQRFKESAQPIDSVLSDVLQTVIQLPALPAGWVAAAVEG